MAVKVLPTSENFLALPAENSSHAESEIVIFSAPYEKTTSYGGGTAKAPQAIIKSSQFVEFCDDEFFRELCFKRGIATLPTISFGKLRGKKTHDKLDKA